MKYQNHFNKEDAITLVDVKLCEANLIELKYWKEI
tara:strand:- start:270 stop:374 length:105 start_codon:yes stop_codon:yes gene_type:complete